VLKFTIIIPIYNAEKYLHRCIISCISQTYSNIEILCVDDCSTDASYEILRDLQKKDKRIMIFRHNKNEGTYMARYTGVINSTGDYIIFLDSDDTLKLYSCRLLSNSIRRRRVDIIQFGYEEMHSNKKVYSPFYNSSYKRIMAYLAKTNRLSPELWTKAYSSNVIKQAYKVMEPFYAILAEDLYVSIVITFFSKTFSFLHKTLVCYSENTGISKRQIYSLEIYQSWLLSYRVIIDKTSTFIRASIPELSILLPDMELYLLRDFLCCRISVDLPVKLLHQIFLLLPVYFSENAFHFFYNELVYRYSMYNTYLDFGCSFSSKLKKFARFIFRYFKLFFTHDDPIYKSCHCSYTKCTQLHQVLINGPFEEHRP
jgi:glycosyltransferase involved in cell wall biosynthesis